MYVFKRVRLCNLFYRSYSNRNILKLSERGLIQDIFPVNAKKEIIDLCNKREQCVYAGFDPTANSLHIGNLLILINLLHWQRGGHNVVAVLGGATGHVGDPSGKTKERNKLLQTSLNENVEGIRNNIETIFSNHEKYFWINQRYTLKPCMIINNEEWYKEMSAVEFVTNLGRNFRIGTMLLKDSVKSRINSESGMSFTEFTYQIFQAYDWLQLLQKFKCHFQVGGNDQMGNILAGHDLISRVEDKQVYGITVPLITTEEGDKFGKSAGNAIWLDSTKTSPFSFYQFFMRTKDSEVEQLLKLFTFYKDGEIRDIIKKHNDSPENRLAQRKLAESVTLLIHGEEELKKAIMASDVIYNRDVNILSKLSKDDIKTMLPNAPITSLILEPGMDVVDIAMSAKCFPTRNDAIRIIEAGGFSINYQKIKNTKEVLTFSAHILPSKLSLLGVGKKQFYVVDWV